MRTGQVNHLKLQTHQDMKTMLKTARCYSQTLRSVSHVTSSVRDDQVRMDRPFEEIPGPKGICNLPLVGPAFFFKPFTRHSLEKVHLFFSELMERYGSLVRVNLGKWVVLAEDPKDIEVILKNEGRYPRRDPHKIHSIYCRERGFNEGVVQLQGNDWYRLRKPLSSRMGRVTCPRHYLPVQNEVADDLVALIKKEKPTPEKMFELIFRYACESLSVVAFNKRLGYLSPDVEKYPEKLQALQDIRDMFRIMNKYLYTDPWMLETFPYKDKPAYKAALDRIVSQALHHYKCSLDDIEGKRKDGRKETEGANLIESLLVSEQLSLSEMGTVAVDIFSGGTDSTARAIQMLLYVLARNPDKQEKLYQEVTRTLGQTGPLTSEATESMKYLKACVRESFRLYHPVLCGTQRYIANDITLQGYNIPAGTSIVLMSQTGAKNKKYFPHPDSYLPERWLRNEEGKRDVYIPPAALTPFGIGARNCLGKRFAEQEIYLAATKILQNFEISLEPGHEEIDIIYQIFIATKKPIRFVFKDRA